MGGSASFKGIAIIQGLCTLIVERSVASQQNLYVTFGSNERKPKRYIQMELKKINRLIAGLIFLTNIYFIPLNYITIRESGGPMGYGLLMLPILLSTNLLMIPAGLTFKQKFKSNILLLIINGAGLIWNLFWLWLYLTTPRIN